MKNIVLAWVFLVATPAIAYQDQVFIKITNTTDKDCVLTKKTIPYGHISDNTQLPDMIFRDQTIEFTMRSGPLRFEQGKDKMLLLTYHCDDNQEISLFTFISPFQDSYLSDPRILGSSTWSRDLIVKTEQKITSPMEVHWTMTKKPQFSPN